MQFADDPHVLLHRVVTEIINLPLTERSEESSESIVKPKPLMNATDFTFPIQIDLPPHVVVPE